MINLIQLLGALFGLFLTYLAFLNMKRKEFSVNEWLIWTAASAGFILISIFPEILTPITHAINFERKLDLLIIVGFMFIIAVVFYTNRITLKNQKKLEELVRRLAIERAESQKKKAK